MSKVNLRQHPTDAARVAWPVSFRDYVLGRKYDFGRGSAASWGFIAFARGDADFPEIATAAELQAYLERTGVPDAMAAAAKGVWRSYGALRSRNRSRLQGARETA